ncbi:MAG: hypothetical protein AVO33_08295 [delta proteobacterium ML8_F1]|jgi:cytoskeletal protein CcmA (bactofilin family)|nr:MAG: hypothetical protein AVO33_08295 [delta proteobacterium ML8_F1]
MFTNETSPKKFSADTYDVIIGKSTKLTGNIHSGGAVRIEGEITGDIEAKGNIIVGNEAIVTGNIKCKFIEISGSVKGNISCQGNLKVYSQGSLLGDVSVISKSLEESGTVLDIEEGGDFQGNAEILLDEKREAASFEPKKKI